MCSVLPTFTIVVIGFVFNGGHAALECPVPPEEILVYFDIEKLITMMLQTDLTGVFQSPVNCSKENDKACDDQRCCGKEVGCCPTDSTDRIRKCGCRDKGSYECSYPAPLAILGKSTCDPHLKMDVVACLREHRDKQDNKLGKNFTLQANEKVQRNMLLTDHSEGSLVDVDIYMTEVLDNL